MFKYLKISDILGSLESLATNFSLMGVKKMEPRKYQYAHRDASFDDLEKHRMIESYLNQDELSPNEAAFLRGYYIEDEEDLSQ